MVHTNGKRQAPATTPKAREEQVIAAAYDLAADQILKGTASSQVLTHFLKAGSERDRLERIRIEQENELIKVKISSIESQKKVEAMYLEALNAMKTYSGRGDTDEEDL